jgi:hypothetical protein
MQNLVDQGWELIQEDSKGAFLLAPNGYNVKEHDWLFTNALPYVQDVSYYYSSNDKSYSKAIKVSRFKDAEGTWYAAWSAGKSGLANKEAFAAKGNTYEKLPSSPLSVEDIGEAKNNKKDNVIPKFCRGNIIA